MIERLPQQWQDMEQRFNEQSGDRRLLVAIVLWLLVTLPLLSYQLLPAVEMHRKQQQKAAQTQQQLAQQQQLQAELMRKVQADVNQPLQQQIERKQQRLNQLEARAKTFTLLDKAERREFLGNALGYPDSISLVSLKSQPPVAIGEDRDYASLYRHQINVAYRGNYIDLLHFFELLRIQHPDVQWKQFNYRVLTYPQAEASLTWELLSIDKEIIGGLD